MLSSDEFDFRYQSFLPHPASRIDFADKEKVVSDLSYYSVLVSLAELELCRGLCTKTATRLLVWVCVDCKKNTNFCIALKCIKPGK